jgi:hypothetical protein
LQLDVNVEMAEDGSGAVEVVIGVDRDGIERIGGDLGAVLDSAALTDAGWVVDGPDVEDDGFTRVRLRRTFADAAAAAAIFDDIAADDGPFQDFALRRDSSFAATTWEFTGRVDFSGGLSNLGDATGPDGEPLGTTAEEIQAQFGESLSRLIQVRVGVRLPGDVTSNATTKAANGAVWQVGFDDRAVDLEATSEEPRTSRLVAVGVVAALGVLLLLFGLVRLAMRSTRRRSEAVGHDGAA